MHGLIFMLKSSAESLAQCLSIALTLK